jgi:hypothetical protein
MPKGVRLNPKHDNRTRAKIQTSQIINRLNKHIKGEIEMTATQVRSAEILLKKALPDLSAIHHSPDVGSMLTIEGILASLTPMDTKMPIIDDKEQNILDCDLERVINL